MCGICGELRFDATPVSRERLVSMRDQLVHRGPDAAGIFVAPSGAAGLGFRRLSIIDLSPDGHQPMPNEDGSVQVAFNGEIYNFAELRRGLVARGHAFRSKTDSEVIAHLYEELGDRCIDSLDGMFAIAIWDEPRQRLLLARDRTGKKPLFYYRDDRTLLFASEMKAFFPRADVAITIDREMVPYYFLYGYAPSPRTFYKDVRQVEAGTLVTIARDGATTPRRYWSWQFPPDVAPAPESNDIDAAARRVRDLTTAAVARRLTADVPLGAFLSGGVDSTIVVGVMSGLLATPVRTFSIGFKDSPGYDETAFARQAATRFHTDHTEFVVDPSAFDLIESLVYHHDGPFGDSSAVPTHIVSRLTRQQVTVVLTGDGGDELFAGYLRFYAAVAAERVPSVLRGALRGVSAMIPSGANSRSLGARAQRFLRAASLPLDERITRWSGLFGEDLDHLLSPEFRAASGSVDPLFYLQGRRAPSTWSPLARVLHTNFSTYLLNDLLVKTDRCTMANSLEARSPFLDTALMDYVATLPDSMKLSNGKTKVVLRRAFADLLPDEIQKRGKMGFGIPFGVWFRGSLREQVCDVLLASDARYQEFVSRRYVQQLVERHLSQQADLGLHLWALLCFEVWLRALPSWTAPRPVAAPVSA